MTPLSPAAACELSIPARAVPLLLAKLAEGGFNPRQVGPGTWIATCPACGTVDGLTIAVIPAGSAS